MDCKFWKIRKPEDFQKKKIFCYFNNLGVRFQPERCKFPGSEVQTMTKFGRIYDFDYVMIKPIFTAQNDTQ